MTVVAGLPIPSDSPLFLAGVGVHVAFGLVALASGLLAMLSPKATGRHPRLGAAYFWALAGLAATAGALALVRWREDQALFGLAVLAFGSAAIGRRARRRLRPGWARRHIAGMGLSYVFMVTAFYVDNGPHLPLWRALPAYAFWILPALVGAPIIAAAMLRHPLARTTRAKPPL